MSHFDEWGVNLQMQWQTRPKWKKGVRYQITLWIWKTKQQYVVIGKSYHLSIYEI